MKQFTHAAQLVDLMRAEAEEAAGVRCPGMEPIPGYRLIEPLGRGGFGEVWKCEAPGGILKAVKFVAGNVDALDNDGEPARQEANALEQVKRIRHPYLLSLDRVEIVHGELTIFMELADQNLHDVQKSYRQAGQKGIPRDELLGYMHEAAEALDLLNQQHGLLHLDVKPQNLFLVARHIKVGDFGLVHSLCDKGEQNAHRGGFTPLYAAPETFRGDVSPQSDQYSLAIVYQELLTGVLPFDGKNSRQLAIQHFTATPDLSPLPECDRLVVGRALSKNSEARFATCQEFVWALITRKPGTISKSMRLVLSAPEDVLDQTDALSHLRDEPAVQKAESSPVPEHRPTHPSSCRPSVSQSMRSGAKSIRLPGMEQFRFVESIGRSPLGEVWKVEDPRKKLRPAKFAGGLKSEADLENAAELLCKLKHPSLAPIEVIQADMGRLLLVGDFPEKTLWDCFQDCRSRGMAGVPRRELVSYLNVVAQGLDAVNASFNLYHLALTPRTLIFLRGEVHVADLGLISLFALPAGMEAGEFNPRYSAPEVHEGKPHATSDQYSLALMYQELLTGIHPLRVQDRGRNAVNKGHYKPDLSLLPASDRTILARALHKDPSRRYPTCAELIAQLQKIELAPQGPTLPMVIRNPIHAMTSVEPETVKDLPSPEEVIAGLIEKAAESLCIKEYQGVRYLVHTDLRLQHHCVASLPPGVAAIKLANFRDRWNAQTLTESEVSFRFRIPTHRKLWQAIVGKQVGLEVSIQIQRKEGGDKGQLPINVEIEPISCSSAQGHELIEQVAPKVLVDLRESLQATKDTQCRERFPLHGALFICPVGKDGKVGTPSEVEAFDLSSETLAFVASQKPEGRKIYLHSELTKQSASLALLARICRVETRPDGRFNVEAKFCVPNE